MPVSNTVLVIVALYVLAVLAIGLYAARKVETGDDFMLAGKRLGPVFIAGTLAATEIGGGSSLGVAQQGFGKWGLSAAWYVLAMVPAFVGLGYLAPRLRSTLTTTPAEYFKRKYGTGTHLITAIVLLLPMIGLTAVQIIASGIVLSILIGVEYQIAVLIMGSIAVGYSMLGGLWSVTFTDIFQWVFVILGIVITVPFALDVVGGWSAMQNQLEPWRFSLTAGIGWRKIISLAVVYFATFAVGQEYLQRYFAAESDSAAKKGSFGAAGTYILFAFFPAILGLAALTYQQQGNTIPFVQEFGSRYVLPGFATVALPDIFLGILFGALVSATMSSADSDLVAASTIVVNDFYEEYVNPNASDEKLGLYSKITTAIIGIAAIGVALLDLGSIVSILLFAFAFRGAALFIPYIGSHYWDSANSTGTFLAIAAGSIVVSLGKLGYVPFGGWDPVIPGLIASLIMFVAGSYLLPDREQGTFSGLSSGMGDESD